MRHALAACGAYSRGEFVPFLKLYKDAPRMAPYLMDLLLGKLRPRAYGGSGHGAQRCRRGLLAVAALGGWVLQEGAAVQK